MTDPDLQTLWQSQPREYDPMTLQDIHGKAKAFQARVRRRNLIEYVACVIVVLGFSPLLFRTDAWMLQLGGALAILGTGVVAWQLHRRASARKAPDGQAVVDFQRAELARQRDALRSVGVWYLAPFVPGMVMILLGRWFQAPVPGRDPQVDHLIIALCSVIAALVFLAVWLLNRLGAHRLQKQIDDLDALRDA